MLPSALISSGIRNYKQMFTYVLGVVCATVGPVNWQRNQNGSLGNLVLLRTLSDRSYDQVQMSPKVKNCRHYSVYRV